MNDATITRDEWAVLGEGLIRLGEKIRAAFTAVAESFRRAFEWAFTDPATKRTILALFERSRYARGQRKAKPRGRRAKREARETWATFLAMQRAKRAQPGDHGALVVAWSERSGMTATVVR